MSLCRYLPVPSDRMGIIWSLLSVNNSIVLEYGPAGTTHFSMGFYGTLGVDWQQRLFTTHMNEDDVVMGDVTRLEEAIIELDQSYDPKVIFVVASSISAVIGTDIKGVCNYMQREVKAKLVAFEQGGFRGDYSVGLTEVYKLLVNNLPQREAIVQKKTYNIIGASMGSYRAASDVWELQNLMREAFGYEMRTCLCHETSVEAVGAIGGAELNLVMRQEGLAAAQILQKNFATPFIFSAPYGYAATLAWLEAVGKLIGQAPDGRLLARLRLKAQSTASLRMASMMMGRKKMPQALVLGDYDLVRGLSAFLQSVGITVKHQLCSHSLKSIAESKAEILHLQVEREKIELLAGLKNTLVLADDVSNRLCDTSNVVLRVSAPVINGAQVASHLPLLGEKGADYLLETIEVYYQTLA